jgi:hypothetical protein
MVSDSTIGKEIVTTDVDTARRLPGRRNSLPKLLPDHKTLYLSRRCLWQATMGPTMAPVR